MRRELEVMRVLRVPPLGKLVVEVNNERFQSLSEMADEKAKRVILAAVGELIDFTGNYQTLVDAGVAPPIPGQKGTGVLEPSLEQRQAEFLARLEEERDAIQPLSASVADVSQPTADAPPVPGQTAFSVAEQINTILQRYILAEPEMAGRSIRLVQDPTGGILIEVDGSMYQKPGDIPEINVQQLIKRAVKEWDAG